MNLHPSFHPSCHHQIIYAKFNLQIYHLSQHCREVWHYNNANTEFIRHAVDQFNWKKAFLNKTVNEKVNIFNEAILNILRNFVPHETVLWDNRDLPWVDNKINSLIREKNIIFKRFRSNRLNICLRWQLNCLQNCLNDSNEASKQKYYCRMINKLTNAKKKFKSQLVNIKKLFEP